MEAGVIVKAVRKRRVPDLLAQALALSASASIMAGQLKAAGESLEDMKRALRDLSPDAPGWRQYWRLSARLALSKKDASKALELATRGLRLCERQLPEGHPDTDRFRLLKAKALVALGAFADATKIVCAVEASIGKHLPSDHPLARRTAELLLQIAERTGRKSDAKVARRVLKEIARARASEESADKASEKSK